MVDYNGSVDVGAGGIQGPLKIPTFNDGNASPFQSFPYFPTQNWGGAGATEITDGTNYNHASFYNPLRPSTDNRVFSPRETSTLLNWGSKSSTLSSSSLMQFFPNSMEPQNPNTTTLTNDQKPIFCNYHSVQTWPELQLPRILQIRLHAPLSNEWELSQGK